jgi:HEAT repeat protein
MNPPSSGKLEYLITQLRHILPTMRYNAARALGELGDSAAVDVLLATVKSDPSQAVREAARIALADLGVDVAENGSDR